MVLSPGTNVAAKVATVQSPGNTDPSLATSPTVKSPLTQTVTNSRPSAILQVDKTARVHKTTFMPLYEIT